MKRRRNPRQLPGWVLPTVIYGAGGYLLYRLVKSIADKIGKTADDAETALAKAIVGKSDVQIAGDIRYKLPNGTLIKPAMTEAAGGAAVIYAGIRYNLVEALGGGVYRLAKA